MEQKSHGALIGSLIIVIILIIGGIYFLKTNIQEKTEPVSQNQNTEVNSTTSDNSTTIENDLNNTNLDNLDSKI